MATIPLLIAPELSGFTGQLLLLLAVGGSYSNLQCAFFAYCFFLQPSV
jgi:hypothetical protein